MTAILSESNDAYGAAVFDKACELAKPEKVSYGSLYSTLERLERKGLLSSRVGTTTPERGGRPRRYFSVTAAGSRALKKADALSRRISGELSELSEAWCTI